MRGWIVAVLAAASCALVACGDNTVINNYPAGTGAGGSTSSLAATTGAGGNGGAASSTDATTGQGGATAGQGGASATTGAGGAGGSGGAGQGGAGGCTPNGTTCDSLPPGDCHDVDNGCGLVDCSKSCQEISCDPMTKHCVCNQASGYPEALLDCQGQGVPYFCGSPGNPDAPAGCVSLGNKVNGEYLWCCPS